MPNSSRMVWPYPAENQDPWFATFEDFVQAVDASGYAAREDRGLAMAGGGSFTFDGGTNTLSWSDTFEILSPIKGFRLSLPAGSVNVEEGQVFYVDLVRSPTNNITLAPLSANQLPSSDTAFMIAIRRNDIMYFRHGFGLPSGVTGPIFGGSTEPRIIWGGGRESYSDEATPLIAGAFAFTPTIYAPVNSIVFRAIAANGDSGLTNYVQLYNNTDDELVAQLEFTSTQLVKDEITLTLGSGSGEIDDPEHIYEVRLLLGATPVDADDTIELYSAEIRVF